MKKLFAMSLLLLSTLGLHAQSFGVKGGFAYSTLNGAKIDGVDMKGRGGFYIGALAELPVTSSPYSPRCSIASRALAGR